MRVLHMVGKPLDRWPDTWPGDVERLATGREAKENLVRVGVFAQPDSMETSMPLARRLGLRILTEYAGPGSVITEMHEKSLLGADNIFNHCTRLTDGEWQLLKAAGAHVTVNPRSDALFGFEAGGFPFQAAIDHGLKPALGVDIDTSMSGDMFAEMRTAFFQQRSVAQAQRVLGNRAMPSAVTVRAILEAATVNSAACLGLADQIGTLTPGKQADIIAIRTDGIAVYPSHNAIGTVVHMIDRADVAGGHGGGASAQARWPSAGRGLGASTRRDGRGPRPSVRGSRLHAQTPSKSVSLNFTPQPDAARNRERNG